MSMETLANMCSLVKFRNREYALLYITILCKIVIDFWPQFSLFCTDHCRPGAGRTGQETEVGLQGGAAHLCYVSGELRVTPAETRRKGERQDRSPCRTSWKGRYLPLIVGTATTNCTWDLGIYSWTNMQLLYFVILPPPFIVMPAEGPQTETEALLLEMIVVYRKDISKESDNMDSFCLFVFFFSQRTFTQFGSEVHVVWLSIRVGVSY